MGDGLTTNLAPEEPDVAETGLAKLQRWYDDRMTEAALDRQGGNPRTPNGITDPMWQVIAASGPFHTRGRLDRYLERLRESDREARAEQLQARHG